MNVRKTGRQSVEWNPPNENIFTYKIKLFNFLSNGKSGIITTVVITILSISEPP
jgi:hypothetical protein